MSKTMIDNAIFNDSWFFDLPPKSKWLFLFLITNDSCSLTGCYEMPLPVLIAYSGLSSEEITECFVSFKGKAFYENNWIIIPNYIKHNPTNNPNIEISRRRIIDKTPQWVVDKLETVGKGFAKGSTSLQEKKRNDKDKEMKRPGGFETLRDTVASIQSKGVLNA